MVDADSFKAKFPEFANADSAVVGAYVADAYLTLSPDAFEDKLDIAVELTVADRLDRSPFGRGAALDKVEGRSPYGMQLDQLRAAAAIGIARVI